jgi:hypothetical protein
VVEQFLHGANTPQYFEILEVTMQLAAFQGI